MDPFDYAFNHTLGLEGGYSNVPADRGGETKYGITRATFEQALAKGIISGTYDIKDLTIAQARAIYRTDYWLPLRLNEIRFPEIAAEIFDTAVNSGAKKATLFAQLALDYLGEPIKCDGVMGPVTIGLLNKWGKLDLQALMVCLNGFQFIHFVSIVDGDLIGRIQSLVKSNPSQRIFARGWTKRIQSYKEG